MRNHNILENKKTHEGKNQEYYNLGEGMLNSARINVKLRYSLIKYFHSIFIQKRGIGAVLQSLFFLYPSDDRCYIEEVANKQFLWDDALMVVGVFEVGVQHISPYFPKDYWYNFHSGTPVHATNEKGSFHSVYSPVSGLIQLFIKGGKIIF